MQRGEKELLEIKNVIEEIKTTQTSGYQIGLNCPRKR